MMRSGLVREPTGADPGDPKGTKPVPEGSEEGRDTESGDGVGSGGTAKGRWSGKRPGSEAQEPLLPTQAVLPGVLTRRPQRSSLGVCNSSRSPGPARFLPARPRPTSESEQPGDLTVGGTRAGGSSSLLERAEGYWPSVASTLAASPQIYPHSRCTG